MYIYVIEDEFKRVKIGISKNPKQRWRDICSQAGLALTRTCSIRREFALDNERRAHHHFSSKQIRGEWFDITFEEACNYIKTKEDKPYYSKSTSKPLTIGKLNEQIKLQDKVLKEENEALKNDLHNLRMYLAKGKLPPVNHDEDV